MDNRRFVTLLVTFFAFTYLWQNLIIPQIAPPAPAPAADVPPAGVEADPDLAAADTGSDVAAGGNRPADGADSTEVSKPAAHPDRRVTLGSTDAGSGFFLQVDLTAAGAAIDSVQLADPKFGELDDREKQLSVIRSNAEKTLPRTFATAVDVIDAQLKATQQNLETINWEVTESDNTTATFAFESPDHTLRVQKTYRLTRVEVADSDRREAFQNNLDGWTIAVELKVSNLSDEAKVVEYEIQGPVGVVLENDTHTRKYRDIKLEFLNDDDAVTMPAKQVYSLYEDQLDDARNAGINPSSVELQSRVKQKDAWTSPFRYAAVDVQFFAVILSLDDDRDMQQRIENKWIERTWPVGIEPNDDDLNKSDVSFRCTSAKIEVPAGHSLTHSYDLFAGPKRRQLLDPEPLSATTILDYGSFFGSIVRGMHSLLDMFHGWGMPYALAILSLTVLVRGCMFPLSRKQAITAARQKALAPKIQELKLKYGDDKQKFAHAQMDMMRKHGINPLSGCLPLFFQFPVFIGLYSCLNTAVDLRLARFLWIDNLAAPDALFQMPHLPFLGTDFSLLPCVTVVLFFIQQKLFMPEPTDEQQAATQKMMNVMTLFFGFMFWHQPAGLCIYFIASSLWGIAERTLLGNVDPPEPTVVVKEPSGGSGSGGSGKTVNGNDSGAEKKGFFGRLMEAAEEAQKQAEKTREKQERQKKGKKKGK